jgi:hypothetical protein
MSRTYVVKANDGDPVGDQQAEAVVIRGDHATFYGVPTDDPARAEIRVALGPGWYIHEKNMARPIR